MKKLFSITLIFFTVQLMANDVKISDAELSEEATIVLDESEVVTEGAAEISFEIADSEAIHCEIRIEKEVYTCWFCNCRKLAREIYMLRSQ